MTSISRRSFLAVLIASSVTSTCFAQRLIMPTKENEFASSEEISFGVRGREGRLLKYEIVQTELQLTAEQTTQIETAMRDIDRLKETELDLRSVSKDEARERFHEFRKRVEVVETKCKAPLTAAQKRRLYEIYLQTSAFSVIWSPEVVAELKISEEQLRQMKSIGDEFMNKYVEIQRSAGRGPDRQAEITKRRDEIEAAARTKSVAVLTAEQQKQWTAMQGAKISFDRSAFYGENLRRGAPKRKN